MTCHAEAHQIHTAMEPSGTDSFETEDSSDSDNDRCRFFMHMHIVKDKFFSNPCTDNFFQQVCTWPRVGRFQHACTCIAEHWVVGITGLPN